LGQRLLPAHLDQPAPGPASGGGAGVQQPLFRRQRPPRAHPGVPHAQGRQDPARRRRGRLTLVLHYLGGRTNDAAKPC